MTQPSAPPPPDRRSRTAPARTRAVPGGSERSPSETVDQVMQALERAGTEQNRKIYARHGVPGPMFGVSFKRLGTFKKQIGVRQSLAEGLWQTGNHDARVLATMIADPQVFKSSQLDAWAGDLDSYVLADAFSKLAARTPFAETKISRWTVSKRESIGQAGWNLVTLAAMEREDLGDDFFLPFVERIVATIHDRPNRVRYAMNQALIAIGGHSEPLRRIAEEAARTIGQVHVDHGETNCETPDALTYIAKIWQRKSRSPKTAL